MIKVVILVLLAEIAAAAGQILFKKGTGGLDRQNFKKFRAYLQFIKDILGMPVIWWGLLLMATGLLFWLMALSGSDLSVVFPLGSMQYILILLGSKIFLDEKIDPMKLLGTFSIIAGITAIALS